MAIDFNASYTMTIDGHPVSSPETIAVVNPATEEVLATPPDATQRQLDQAVDRANDSDFGLGASVWAGDYREGQRIAERLQAGTVWVNEIHTISPHKPMAGHKQSGIGVENGLIGLLEYTVPQTL